MSKFFKVANPNEDIVCCCLLACSNTTPIPTIEEIVNRFNWNLSCLTDTVEQISKEEFLRIHNLILEDLVSDDNNDCDNMVFWAPNNPDSIHSWDWWYSQEEWDEWWKDKKEQE